MKQSSIDVMSLTPERRLTRLISRWVLFLCLCCTFCFSVGKLFHPNLPVQMTSLDGGTDHISHQYSTLLFYYKGTVIYQKSVNQLVEAPKTQLAIDYAKEHGFREGDYFIIPERHKPERPVLLNWPNLARVYPPGLYLYTLPEAIAVEWELAPTKWINGFSIAKYLLVSHLGMWFLIAYLIDSVVQQTGLVRVCSFALLIIIFFVLQIQGCVWALEGFYDGIAILFLIHAIIQYRKKDWLTVLFFFSLAVFFIIEVYGIFHLHSSPSIILSVKVFHL